MDLKLLDVFMRVASCGSMNRAAKELHLTQPALARHIDRLEHQLGHTLFFRSPGGMQLTEAGRRLAQSAPGLLEQAANLRELLDGEPNGQVTLGAPSSMLHLVVAPTILEMRRVAPRLTLKLVENNSGELSRYIEQGAIDIAIVLSNGGAASAFEQIDLIEEPLILARASTLAPLENRCGIDALADYPLICPTRPSLLRSMVENALRAAHLPFKVSIEGESLALVSEMLKRGVGQAVLSACALYQFPNAADLSLSKIDGLTVRWALKINRRRTQTVAVRRTVEVLQTMVATRHDSGVWPFLNSPQSDRLEGDVRRHDARYAPSLSH